MMVTRVKYRWPAWPGHGLARHNVASTGKLWKWPATQLGVQSLNTLRPVASAAADPQVFQRSRVREAFPSAQASTYWRGRVRPCMRQLTTTGTLLAAAVLTAGACGRPAVTADAAAVVVAASATMPHAARAAALTLIRVN